MPRIHLDLPQKFLFTAEIPVRITDLNYGQHVGNDVILGMVQEARIQFLRSLGYENELHVEGFGIIMTDSAVVYKNEITYGMKVKIEIGVKDYSKYGFDIYYKLTESLTFKELALAKTGIVFFDYENKKIALMPHTFIIKMNL
jgi:acyl-CoA thioester hydrolase